MGNVVRLASGLMTDDAMGLVNCYLGYPPPLGKRAQDCNDWVFLKYSTPSCMA